MDITILMSTYNGEKFLREQLDSIFSQSDVKAHLIVRDDGSSDRTLTILENYSNNYSGQVTIIKGNNIGWKKSFFSLLNYAYNNISDCEYFAFSDQDDIWLSKKLSVAINKLKNLPPGANLYCSNQFFYKDGKNLGLIRKDRVYPTYKNCLVRNYATGCTIVFNKTLLNLIGAKLPSVDTAHDYWVYQASVLCGNVFVDPDSYILYRQHDANQIGSKSGFLDVWKRRLNNLRKSFSDHQREKQAQELLHLFSNYMSSDAQSATEKMANYRNSLRAQFHLFGDSGYDLGRMSNNFWLKLRILFRTL